MPPPFYGKYRGKVENNIDPFNQGRIQVSVPDVLGSGRMSWAMPCVPFAGSGKGFFAVPPNKANVWVEFEAGDPNRPIWVGGFWDQGETTAAMPALFTTKAIKTDCIEIKMDDLPGAGGLTITVSPPAVTMPMTLEMKSTGIKLALGSSKIEITPAGVAINGTNLVVLP
jgi:hypothetical protein